MQTAEEMRHEILTRFDDADAVVMAAAVADFRPKAVAESKLKKEQGVPELVLEPTPDVLAELGERKRSQVLVGFAAETDDVEAAGRAKLERKHLDLVVANTVGREGTGFGSDDERRCDPVRRGRVCPDAPMDEDRAGRRDLRAAPGGVRGSLTRSGGCR